MNSFDPNDEDHIYKKLELGDNLSLSNESTTTGSLSIRKLKKNEGLNDQNNNQQPYVSVKFQAFCEWVST